MSGNGWSVLALIASAVLGAQAQAATVLVSPGDGTLQAAVDAATSGDVLELTTGIYSGATSVSGKHLTVRALSASEQPVLTSSLTQASTHRLVLQGLHLVDASVSQNTSALIVLLQNRLTRVSFYAPNGCHAIGNTFDPQGAGQLYCGTSTSVLGSTSVFAGNDLVSKMAQCQAVYLGGSPGTFHVVGNRFVGRDQSNCGIGVAHLNGGSGTVLGNRFELLLDSDADRGDGVFRPIMLSNGASGEVTIRNNAFVLQDASAVQTGTFGYRIAGVVAIDHASGTSTIKVLNNVFDYRNADFGTQTDTHASGSGAIAANAPIEVSGNIFMRMDQRAFTSTDASGAGHSINGNLCFQTGGSCPGTSAIVADPLLVDADNHDFRLGTGSPAINAGPTSPFLQDIDGTRNDLGVHGGPFDISQFDAQRGTSTQPFVYPLFDANRSIDADGNLQIRLFGAARHQ